MKIKVQQLHYQNYQRNLRDVCFTNYISLWTHIYLNSVALEKSSALSIILQSRQRNKKLLLKRGNPLSFIDNLSKFLDCLSQELLLEKLAACVFRIAALKLVQSYLYQARSFLFSREKNDYYYDYDVGDDGSKFSFPLIFICNNSNDEQSPIYQLFLFINFLYHFIPKYFCQ